MPSQQKPFRRTAPAARRPGPSRLATAVLAALAAALGTAPAHPAPYSRGEEVIVAGRVTDAGGRPLPGVEVVLTGHRRDFDVWSFRTRARGDSALTAITDDQGAYSISWRWDPFYNRFRLAAGIRQQVAGEETWWEVGAVELTRAMKRGSPVVANLTIDEAEEVRDLQSFLATIGSGDARRVYRELGKPDKVRQTQLPRHLEVTWWYFERGMMYRFVDGALDSSESFEPVAAEADPGAEPSGR